jgi:hypothetical protein
MSCTRPGQATDLLDLFEQHTVRHELDPGFFCHIPFVADLVGDNPGGRGGGVHLRVSDVSRATAGWDSGCMVPSRETEEDPPSHACPKL